MGIIGVVGGVGIIGVVGGVGIIAMVAVVGGVGICGSEEKLKIKGKIELSFFSVNIL